MATTKMATTKMATTSTDAANTASNADNAVSEAVSDIVDMGTQDSASSSTDGIWVCKVRKINELRMRLGWRTMHAEPPTLNTIFPSTSLLILPIFLPVLRYVRVRMTSPATNSSVVHVARIVQCQRGREGDNSQ